MDIIEKVLWGFPNIDGFIFCVIGGIIFAMFFK